ncbi:MAG: GNAT family N-acetyltransferase [Planctomycetota bacterium]|jgi:predicted N-acetyltransferase YhbS
MGIEIREAASASDWLTAARLGQLAFADADAVALVEQARRLAAPRRSRATTWLLLSDGEAVSSLLAYDLTLRRADDVWPCVGLGSVATHPSFRSRGFASQLCSHVVAHHGGTSLLFSAIPAAFYERLGFVACPAWNFQCADPAALADSGPRAELVPLDPRREVDLLSAAWRNSHASWYLNRDEAGWATTLLDNPDDLWFRVGSGGYLRILIDEDGLDAGECCADNRDAVLRAAAALAVDAGASPVTGWLEPSPLVLEHFTDVGRERTLPMLAGIDDPATARFSSADYF